VIPAQGFFLVWADGQKTNGTADLHVDFKLSKSGECIGLFGADGSPVDYVTFGIQADDVSEGRYPDGGALRLFMPIASPRAPNILPPAPSQPFFTGFAMPPDGSVSLSFQTSPGHTYRVEFKNDLAAPGWMSLSGDIFATSAQTTVTDPGPPAPQRYYRIVQAN